MSPVEKPIFVAEQMRGHESMWADDPIRRWPFLLVNSITDSVTGQTLPSGPIGYTHSPQIPPAMAALLQLTEQDMTEILGNHQAAEKLEPNVSGIAIEKIQNKLDMQAFIYMSNMAKAVKRSGEIWLSMARDLFVEQGRKMKSMNAQGQASTIELLKPKLDPKTGEKIYENDLREAEFDVVAEAGPSSDSKRASTVRALTAMMAITKDPETLQVLTSMAMMNMEGEGIGDVRDFFRQRLLHMGAVKPTEEEKAQLAAEMQNRPPDPQAQYLSAAADQAQAEAASARADTVLTVAKAEETRAKMVQTLAKVDIDQRDQLLKTVDALDKSLQTEPVS
jgi:hypothetical protein